MEQVEVSLLPVKLFFPRLYSFGYIWEWALNKGNTKNNHDRCISRNALVSVDSPELGSGRKFPLGKTGKGSRAFWEEGRGSWVSFPCSLGSYPSSSGNGTLTIPSYTGSSFSPFSSFPVMFSAFWPLLQESSGSSPRVRRCFAGYIVCAVGLVESTYSDFI